MIPIQTRLSESDAVRAIHHVAGLFETRLASDGLVQFVSIRVDLANPDLVVQLGPERLEGVDPAVRVDVGVRRLDAGGTEIVLASRSALYYMTGALGLEADGLNSFASTLRNTLVAMANRTKLPTFPAPPRPPEGI
jgi:hypothetical protein